MQPPGPGAARAALLLLLPATAAAPVQAVYGINVLGTLMNFWFFMAAMFGDVLLVKLCLVLAYVFVIANALSSLRPPDPATGVRTLAVGPLAWSAVILVFLLLSVAQMLWDERPVKLSTPRDEAVWRCFVRRCGMARTEFVHVCRLGEWRHYPKGAIVEDRQQDAPRLHLIYRGRLRLESGPEDGGARILLSGRLANLYLTNLFGVFVRFECDPVAKRYMVADTDAALLSWSVADLLALASGRLSVALPAYWRSFVLHSIATDFTESYLHQPALTATGDLEPAWAAVVEGTAPCSDFALPLLPAEVDRVTPQSLWRWLRSSFSPLVPPGLRHRANPQSGALARQRVLLAAHLAAARCPIPPALASALASDRDSGWSVAGGSRSSVLATAAVLAEVEPCSELPCGSAEEASLRRQLRCVRTQLHALQQLHDSLSTSLAVASSVEVVSEPPCVGGEASCSGPAADAAAS